ncbi:AAA family ATPase [Clostridium hydrogeniformans]|uniref:AAA family ATPase n=1 Tax=Clostridium hydrogeniformans TaxID=349933 RepID=UPI00068A5A98|nr:MoxR family ATPase [Clostridium hydrogeniformans]
MKKADLNIEKFIEFKNKVHNNVGKVIIGKEDKIDKIIVAFIASGHVLLEDVPGTGKTKLAKAFAATLNCSFKRIQFTPDLLPSDLTGIYFYNQKELDFQFKKGPILSEFVLADEINRATPRTQSALLEAMEERQVTVEGNTIKLSKPFFVMATENPVEQYGTFPLPEAQLDRFFLKLSLGYPEFLEEKAILDRFIQNDPLEKLEGIIGKEEISYVQENYIYVEVKDSIKEYILNIIESTRSHRDIHLGASPRGSLALMKGAQGYAAINGRDYVIPEDVKTMAISILSHRIILKSSLGGESHRAKGIIEEILNTVESPLEKI